MPVDKSSPRSEELCTEACKALPGSARILPSNCATLALYVHRNYSDLVKSSVA